MLRKIESKICDKHNKYLPMVSNKDRNFSDNNKEYFIRIGGIFK